MDANLLIRLRPPRYVSTGPVVVRLAEMANKRERERDANLFLIWTNETPTAVGVLSQAPGVAGRPLSSQRGHSKHISDARRRLDTRVRQALRGAARAQTNPKVLVPRRHLRHSGRHHRLGSNTY